MRDFSSATHASAAHLRLARRAEPARGRSQIRPRFGLPTGDHRGDRTRRQRCVCERRCLEPVLERSPELALPSGRETSVIEIEGVLVSQPYIAMTLAVMESFGVTVNNRKFRRFDVRPAHYKGCEYAVEPDASAASYFFALAALTGGTVTVEGLGTSSIQGDMAFVDVLEHMGCTVTREPKRTTVIGGPLARSTSI